MNFMVKSQIGKEDVKWWNGADTAFTRRAVSGGKISLTPMGDMVDVEQIYGDRTSEAIQVAINALGSNNANLLLSPGEWEINNTVNLGTSNVGLIGTNGTIINNTTSSAAFKQTTHGVKNTFRDLSFEGSGVGIEYACDDSGTAYDEYLIEDCSFVMDTGIYGIYLVGAREGKVRNCYFETGNGIYTSHSSYRTIEGCVFKNGGTAIYDNGGGSAYSTGSYLINTEIMGYTIGVKIVLCDDFYINGCTIDYNDTNILLQGQDSGIIIGSYIGSRTATSAITIESSDATVSEHIRIFSNRILGHYTDDADYDCITVTGANYIDISHNSIDFYTRDGISYDGMTFGKIIGNHFARRATFEAGYAIRGANDSDSNVIAFNTIGAGTFSGVTSAQLFNNRGYYTSWSGTATLGSDQTSVTVSHLMTYTPSAGEIMVTPASTLYSATQFWISDLGETTFKINVDATPTGGDVTFNWMLRKRHY